jgi:Na+/H+ antiporter NhaD/arsenite permease-like protein
LNHLYLSLWASLSGNLEKDIEWPSLGFFIMLFIVVGAAEHTGILQVFADWIKDICQGRLWVAIIVVVWVSGIASAIVDNIPYTATMLPIIAFLNQSIPGAESGVLLVSACSRGVFWRKWQHNRGVGECCYRRNS